MADERRVSTALAYVIGAGGQPRVSTAMAYAVGYGGEQRVSTAMAYVVEVPFYLTLIQPVDGILVDDYLVIEYEEFVDPQGRDVTYYAEVEPTGGGGATAVFSGRTSLDPYTFDTAGLANGDWKLRVWADAEGDTTEPASRNFTVDHGIPSEPVITAPLMNSEHVADPMDIDIEPAVDPDGDPLTYDARYTLANTPWLGTFPVFSDLAITDFPWSWDLTGFSNGPIDLEVWAKDDNGNVGSPDKVRFEIVSHDQPAAPVVTIERIGEDYVTAKAREYAHPYGRAWQATRYIVWPFGGDASNAVIDVTTTDPTYQLLSGDEIVGGFEFLRGLAVGFEGVVGVLFQDELGSWGEMGTHEFQVVEPVGDWETRWYPANWDNYGGWIRGKNLLSFQKTNLGGYGGQPLSALVVKDAPSLGSAYLEVELAWGGCWCGWPGNDTELRQFGLGLFAGWHLENTTAGVAAYVDTSPGNPVCTSHSRVSLAGLRHLVEWDPGSFVHHSLKLPEIAGVFGTDWPWYRVQLLIERDLAALQTRVRTRITGPGCVRVIPDDEWFGDYTYSLSPCGKPGILIGQLAYGWPSALNYFRNFKYVALRDKGLGSPVTVPALPDVPDDAVPACTPEAEPAQEAPVLFPAPVNWREALTEEIAYRTDVILGQDRTEQRVQLREVPVTTVSWTATLADSREVGVIEALLYERQPSRWGVPLWSDAVRVTQELGSGQGSIPAAAVDTSDRRFGESPYVALFRSPYEAVMIGATLELDGSITLDTPTARTWPVGTWVVPVKVGRLAEDVSLPRPGTTIAEIPVSFTLEAVQGGA